MSTPTKLNLLEKRAMRINDPRIRDICGGAIEDEDGNLYKGAYDENGAWYKRIITKTELDYHEINCKECEYFIILNRPKIKTDYSQYQSIRRI